MTFADFAANDDIFLDVNTLVHYFASHQVFGPTANQLMTRIESQQGKICYDRFQHNHMNKQIMHMK